MSELIVSRLDIIIFGATGFTGKRTIPRLTELLKSENLSLTWGIAGRTEKKLRDTLTEMQKKSGEDYSNIPIIYADINNIESLENMTSKARIIINGVGPYRIFGEKVIQACIKTGTHHIDISGELQFMENMQLKYHDTAKEKGIYLISACGFESIPTDLGILYLQKNFNGTLNSVEAYMNIKNENGLHPGTIAHYASYESAIHMFTHRNELKDIRSRLYPKRLPEFEPKLKFKGLAFRNNLLQRDCTMFPSPDRSVATRTQRYMYDTYKQRPVQIQTYLSYNNFLQIIAIGIMSFVFVLMSMFNSSRKLLLRHPKFFTWYLISHDGPSEEQQENTTFDLVLIGKGWCETSPNPTGTSKQETNKRLTAKISGRNPAYGSTCIIFALAAIIILTEHGKMPNNGGCYPPGAAFANTSMVEKLNKHGIKFELNPTL